MGFHEAASLTSVFLIRSIVDQLFASDREQKFFPWVLIMLKVSACLAGDIISTLNQIVTAKLRGHSRDNVTTAVYKKMTSLSAKYHENKNSAMTWDSVNRSGIIVSSFINDVVFHTLPKALELVLRISTLVSVCGLHVAAIMALALSAHIFVLLKTSKTREGTQKHSKMSDATKTNWRAMLF